MKDKPSRHDCTVDEIKKGLVDAHRIRDAIATFLDRNSCKVDEFITTCDRNGWDASVAFELRAAMFQLGSVLATLVLWDREILPDIPGDRDKALADIRRLEEEYARKNG